MLQTGLNINYIVKDEELVQRKMKMIERKTRKIVLIKMDKMYTKELKEMIAIQSLI